MKRHAEQAPSRVECSLDHAIEIEVRLDRGLVDVATALAQLFGIVPPIPRREREVAALFLRQRLQGIAVGQRLPARPRPYRVEQVAHCCRRLRHGIVEPIMREIGKAEQPRALGPQPHHLGDDLLVVGRSAVVAAMDEGLKGLLAQIAPAGKLQERLYARTRQRHHIAVETAFFGIGLHGLANEIGQPGKLGLALKHKLERLLVGQHVLAERGAERREAFDDRGEAFFGRFIEARAGAAERGVVALDDALLFVGQVERGGVAHQRVDAAKKRAVGVDAIPMAVPFAVRSRARFPGARRCCARRPARGTRC